MDRKVKKYLYDIFAAIEEIELFVRERSRRYDAFCEDLCFQRAVQMNIAIIGDAVNRVLKEQSDIEIFNARQIVNTRNYVIHGYDSLRLEMLWAIVIKDLPILKQEVSKLLER